MLESSRSRTAPLSKDCARHDRASLQRGWCPLCSPHFGCGHDGRGSHIGHANDGCNPYLQCDHDGRCPCHGHNYDDCTSLLFAPRWHFEGVSTSHVAPTVGTTRMVMPPLPWRVVPQLQSRFPPFKDSRHPVQPPLRARLGWLRPASLKGRATLLEGSHAVTTTHAPLH